MHNKSLGKAHKKVPSIQARIAIYCPTIGATSETFIKRYIQQLLPGRTVVVTEFPPPPDKIPAWIPDCPTFHISASSSQLCQRAWSIGRKMFSVSLMRWGFADTLQFLREHKVSVVMGNWLDAAWPMTHLLRSSEIKFFGHAHGYDLSRCYKDPNWRRRLQDYRDSQGVIVVNQLMKKRLIELDIAPHRIHLIPYGVEAAQELTPKVPAKGQQLRCLAVGRMVNKKAPITVLNVIKKALQESDRLALDYVGDGPLFAAAQKYVEENHLSNVVTLHGERSHDFVLELMGKSDVLIQHSRVDPQTGDEEGLPLVILEAMAHGLAVVATRHAGIPEAVSNNESGMLVEEGDIEGMAECLIQLANDYERICAMGAKARSRYVEEFTWDRERQRLLEAMELN